MIFDVDFTEQNASLGAEFEQFQEVQVRDHSVLKNRELENQHPIHAITGLADEIAGLENELDSKMESSDLHSLSNEDIELLLKGS